jgi:cell division protein FtsA
VYRTGIDIDDLVFSIIATGGVVTTPRQRELGCAVVNIGGATTSVVVYADGDIVHSAVLPIGSAHITNDLAIGLRTSIDLAEEIKIMHGHAVSKDIKKGEEVIVVDPTTREEETVPLRFTAEIIEARVSEIFAKIMNELERVQAERLLPAGIIFTGGGAKLGGLVDLAKQEIQLPAALGYPVGIESITEKVNDIACATAVGLVHWGTEFHPGGGNGMAFRSMVNPGKVAAHVQKLFKTLLP